MDEVSTACSSRLLVAARGVPRLLQETCRAHVRDVSCTRLGRLPRHVRDVSCTRLGRLPRRLPDVEQPQHAAHAVPAVVLSSSPAAADASPAAAASPAASASASAASSASAAASSSASSASAAASASASAAQDGGPLPRDDEGEVVEERARASPLSLTGISRDYPK